jgi:hypothetical protein
MTSSRLQPGNNIAASCCVPEPHLPHASAATNQHLPTTCFVVLLSLQSADAACCTLGQPSFVGNGTTNPLPLGTCSDGPCSGPGFNYTGPAAYESNSPDACCYAGVNISDPYNSVSTAAAAEEESDWVSALSSWMRSQPMRRQQHDAAVSRYPTGSSDVM